MDRNELVEKLRKVQDDFESKGKPICISISVKDILDAFDDPSFNQKWISPKDQLPTLGQEVEFIATYRTTHKRRRFQGHFQKAEDGSDFKIFYAHSIGWGCEFLIEEVEYWMTKVPIPEKKK